MVEPVPHPVAITPRVKVLGRIFELLECFTPERPELGVTELSTLTGMQKSTVHRLLSDLRLYRLIEQDPVTNKYRLGLKFLDFGSRVLVLPAYVKTADPHLRSVADATGETLHLATPEHGMACYLSKVEGWHSLRVPTHVGTRLPMHCTGVGKVLLAYMSPKSRAETIKAQGLKAFTPNTICNVDQLEGELALVRTRGYALDSEEIEVGLRCVAAPIRDLTGSVVASVSIAAPATRMEDDVLPAFIERITTAANDISRDLGFDHGQTSVSA